VLHSKEINRLIRWAGDIAALLGMAACAASGAFRLTGAYIVAGLELGTLFILGVGLMVFACLTKLHLLLDPRDSV